MLRSTDKARSLQRRKELKDKSAGGSSDLTVRQRAELKQARNDDYFAYFRGGVCYTRKSVDSKPALDPGLAPTLGLSARRGRGDREKAEALAAFPIVVQ